MPVPTPELRAKFEAERKEQDVLNKNETGVTQAFLRWGFHDGMPPLDYPIVTYSHAGPRAQKTMLELKELGYTNVRCFRGWTSFSSQLVDDYQRSRSDMASWTDRRQNFW